VCASRSYLEGAARAFLTTELCQVGSGEPLEHVVGERLKGRRVYLAAKVRNELGQVADWNGLYTGEGRLRCGLGGADQTAEPGTPSSLRHRKRSDHGTNSTVEGELTDGRVLGETLGRELPRRSENSKRDRQIEARSFLPQCRRSEIDGYPAVERPFERRRHDAAPHAMLRLLARSVREPHDGESRDARLQMRLDLDLARFETDESMSDRTCKHASDGRRQGATQG